MHIMRKYVYAYYSPSTPWKTPRHQIFMPLYQLVSSGVEAASIRYVGRTSTVSIRYLVPKPTTCPILIDIEPYQNQVFLDIVPKRTNLNTTIPKPKPSELHAQTFRISYPNLSDFIPKPSEFHTQLIYSRLQCMISHSHA